MANWYKTASEGYQKGWVDDFGPISRYVYDSYDCKVHMTKTSRKVTVAITMSHMSFGHQMYQDFWSFSPDEEAKAKTVFAQVKEITSKVFDDFRTNDIPNPMLHSFLREELRHVAEEHKPSTRIPFVDWAKSQDGVSDWRNSIYGTRYPTHHAEGF